MSIQWQGEVYRDPTPRPTFYPCRVCGNVVNHEPNSYCTPCLMAKMFGPEEPVEFRFDRRGLDTDGIIGEALGR